MPPLSEIRAVEAPVAEWLSKMGWHLRSAEDLKAHKRAMANPVIETILIERIAAINGPTSPWHGRWRIRCCNT